MKAGAPRTDRRRREVDSTCSVCSTRSPYHSVRASLDGATRLMYPWSAMWILKPFSRDSLSSMRVMDATSMMPIGSYSRCGAPRRERPAGTRHWCAPLQDVAPGTHREPYLRVLVVGEAIGLENEPVPGERPRRAALLVQEAGLERTVRMLRRPTRRAKRRSRYCSVWASDRGPQ